MMAHHLAALSVLAGLISATFVLCPPVLTLPSRILATSLSVTRLCQCKCKHLSLTVTLLLPMPSLTFSYSHFSSFLRSLTLSWYILSIILVSIPLVPLAWHLTFLENFQCRFIRHQPSLDWLDNLRQSHSLRPLRSWLKVWHDWQTRGHNVVACGEGLTSRDQLTKTLLSTSFVQALF